VAPAADPKSLLGAIDVPCKMSGNLNFSILKIRFSNFKLSSKNIFQGHSKNYLHFRQPSHASMRGSLGYSCTHVAWHGLEPRAIELTVFRSKNRQLMRVSLLIHLHARKITACTVFAVADNVKNNETRGTVF
jgi:hypothetical protein